MKETGFEIMMMVERLHRIFFDILKYEIDKIEVKDITGIQLLILYSIGKNKHLTHTELRTRGYYLGSNVSYNLKHMISNGYIEQIPSEHDRRIIPLTLSTKGRELFKQFEDIFENQINRVGGGQLIDFEPFNRTLKFLEEFGKLLFDKKKMMHSE